MKPILFLPLALFATTAAAQDSAPADDDGPPIVVTGTSLKQTERALRECLARNCPPNEDIDASLAHAENLFVAGDYNEARAVARKSIGRNSRHAEKYPVDVSDLYRAHSRIAAHMGEREQFVSSTFAVKRALRKGLPDTDPRILGAEFEIAGMYASVGQLDRARRAYEEIEKDAEKIGRLDLAATARVRSAWLHQLGGFSSLARKELREIAGDSAPEARIARLTASVLLARLDRQAGETESSEALVEALRGAGGSKPVLLFSPSLELHKRGADEGGSVTRMMANDHFKDSWVDVGFWVTPQGRVSEVEILRAGGPSEWAKPLLRTIEGRIYAPLEDPAGSYRVERYTYTAFLISVTGSRIRSRHPEPRIEYLDLTAEAPEPSR